MTLQHMITVLETCPVLHQSNNYVVLSKQNRDGMLTALYEMKKKKDAYAAKAKKAGQPYKPTNDPIKNRIPESKL